MRKRTQVVSVPGEPADLHPPPLPALLLPDWRSHTQGQWSTAVPAPRPVPGDQEEGALSLAPGPGPEAAHPSGCLSPQPRLTTGLLPFLPAQALPCCGLEPCEPGGVPSPRPTQTLGDTMPSSRNPRSGAHPGALGGRGYPSLFVILTCPYKGRLRETPSAAQQHRPSKAPAWASRFE